jgi:hypothetical protein
MAEKNKKKDGHKDKFDENTSREGMGTVDNEDVSEETGYNRRQKNDDSRSGDGIEEFIDDDPNFVNGENDDNEEDI